jgi:hypothetical protein
VSGPLDDLDFEPADGKKAGGALDDLGFQPAEAPAPPAPEKSALEQFAEAASLASSEPGGGRDYQDPTMQRAQIDAAGPSLWAAAKYGAPLAFPAGAGLGAMGRVGLQAAEAGGWGGLTHFLESDNPDAKARAMEALAAAGKDAVIGGAVGNVAESASGIAQELAPALRSAGDWLAQKGLLNRVASTGATAPQMQALASNRGEDYLLELGKAIEEKGLHKGSGALGFLPQNAQTILGNAEQLGKTSGSQMAAAEAKMRELGDPIIDATPAMDRLNSEVADASTLSHPNNQARGDFAQNYIDRFASMPHVGQATPLGPLPPAVDELNMPLSNALAEKRDIYNQINWGRRGGVQSGPNEEVLGRDLAGIFNRQSNSAMDAAVAGGDLPPELVQGWRQANQDFGTAQQVQDFAQGRAFRDQAGPPVDHPGWATFGPKGIAAMSVGQAFRSRGRSALAGTEGAMSGMLGGASDAMSSFADMAQGTPTGPMAADARELLSGKSQGHTLERTVKQAVEQNPQALGPYAQRFQEAAQSGDPMRITALIYELQEDPVWRTQYKPALSAATNQEGM